MGASQSVLKELQDVTKPSQVKFLINDKLYTLAKDVPMETRLVDYLRDVAGLKGTKYMCREGGCGLCTVTVKSTHPVTGEEMVYSVNACLVYVQMCNGWAITTVEGLGDKKQGYHRIQAKLALMNGTQCGYCSPGMVMAMHSYLESHKNAVTKEEVERALGGNICRCTGYRPILDTFQSFSTNACERVIQKCADIEIIQHPRELCVFKAFITTLNMATQLAKFVRSMELTILEQLTATTENDNQVTLKISNYQYSFCSMQPAPRITSIQKLQEICNKSCKSSCKKLCKEEMEIILPSAVKLTETGSRVVLGEQWFVVSTVEEVFQIFDMIPDDKNYMLVAGNTAHGVYRNRQPIHYFIQISNVQSLRRVDVNADSIVLGGSTTLTEAIILFHKFSEKYTKFKYLRSLSEHLDKVAHPAVRNVGTLAGNLFIKKAHPEFPSDLFILLETVGATLTIREGTGLESVISPSEFLQTNMNKKMILSITFPSISEGTYLRTFKIMPRAQNAHAIVNAGFLFNFDPTDKLKRVTSQPVIVFGGISSTFIHARNLEQFLMDKSLLTNEILQRALFILSEELVPTVADVPGSIHLTPEPEFDPVYRKQMALALFYKFALGLSQDTTVVNPVFISGSRTIQDERPVSDGQINFNTDKKLWPLTKPIPKIDGLVQCAGEAEYVNDLPKIEGELFAAVLMADRGPAKIKSLDTSKALKYPGVRAFVTAKDIPGKNVIVELSDAELIFADTDIQFAGQFIGAIVADNFQTASEAVGLIQVTYSDTRTPEFSLRKIVESGDMARITKAGEVKPTSEKKPGAHKFQGCVDLGGQYYFTMEPQTALCVPSEDGLDVFAATQWVSLVQEMVAGAVNLPVNRVNVKTRRVGGGYGSKLSRSCFPAVVAAVCSSIVDKPVKVVMPIETMSSGLGRRYSVYATYEGTVDDNGVIQSFKSIINVDEGASNNESSAAFMPDSIGRLGLYDSSTFDVTINSVKTDTPTTSWVRSPGVCEIAAYLENIMEHISTVVDKDPADIRAANFKAPEASNLLKQLQTAADYDERMRKVQSFNKENRWRKRGLSPTVTAFPIGFFDTAYAILSVFKKDGTVAITTSGIEVGQGLHTKVAQAAAYELNIPLESICLKPALSQVFPNAVGTGGSTGSDLAARCIIECCKELKVRLKPIYDENPNMSWKEIVMEAVLKSIDLQVTKSVTPTQNPDLTIAYLVITGAITEVEVDLLTGQHQVSRVDILQDAGISVNPDIDAGQIQGAFIMGMGNWTTEHLVRHETTGALMSNRTWNYKPPGALDIPVEFNVTFLEAKQDPKSGPYGGKAVGEPPLLASCSVMNAIKMALRSARGDAGLGDKYFDMTAPFTSERIFLNSAISMVEFRIK